MKRRTFVAAIATLILATITSSASLAQSNVQPYIDTNTTIEREVTPNEIHLRITIDEKEYKGKKTFEEAQKAMLKVLQANNIDIDECLSINYMDSEVSYKAFSKNIKAKTNATYTLKLNNVNTMQAIISSLEEQQISNIVLAATKYTHENILKAQMGVEAMQQAKAEAEMLAGAIGQQIGKAISINYYTNNVEYQPRMYKARNYDTANIVVEESAAAEPSIGIGKLKYRFTANVRFELK